MGAMIDVMVDLDIEVTFGLRDLSNDEQFFVRTLIVNGVIEEVNSPSPAFKMNVGVPHPAP